MNTPTIDPHTLKQKEEVVVHKIVEKRDNALQRIPIVFTLLGTFGLVATFYGFEHIIDNIDLLANNPLILLTVGISSLLVTGKLYSKLD